jgi:hypothetical protein
MRHKWITVFGLSVFALSGCTTVYEGTYYFSEGWREAKVIQIARSSEIAKPQFSDCRGNVSPQHLASDKFIVLSYKHLNRPRKRVVPFGPSDGVRVEDLVYMNVTDCDKPLIPRSEPPRLPQSLKK